MINIKKPLSSDYRALEKKSNTLTILHGIGWFLLLILAPNILGFLVTNIIFNIDHINLDKINIRALLTQNIITAVFTIPIISHLRKSWPTIICTNKINNKRFIYLLLIGLILSLTITLISHIIGIEKIDFLKGIEDSVITLVMGFISICIIGPIIEEIIYRGVIFTFLHNMRINNSLTLLISSIIFTLIHQQYGIAELSMIFIFAIFLGTIRLKTNNIIICIAIHSLNNIYGFLSYVINN